MPDQIVFVLKAESSYCLPKADPAANPWGSSTGHHLSWRLRQPPSTNVKPAVREEEARRPSGATATAAGKPRAPG